MSSFGRAAANIDQFCSATARSSRDLGLPCVRGTEGGSRRIRDGQQFRVDGDAGTVEVLG